MSLLYKPFEMLGDGLRNLSLSGDVGNIAAIIIYCLLSLIPAFIWIILKNKKRLVKIDGFLIILSGVLFFIIYYLINPTLFMTNGLGDVTLIGMFYSLLVGYIVLRGITVWSKSDVVGLQKGIRCLIYLMILTIIGAILMECIVTLPESIQALKDKNTAVTDPWMTLGMDVPDLTFTIVFLVLGSFVKIGPYIFEILILIMILNLMKELEKDRYSEAVVSGLDKLGNMCKYMVLVTVSLNMGFAILQVIFRNMLYQINMDVTISLASIVIVLGVMMISKYVRETQKMKEELDMFI